MIPRIAAATLQTRASHSPVIPVTRPRQSGRAKLARAAFADKPYVSLEDPVAPFAFGETGA
ncbi:MAG: hypothetical protein IT515_09765 [Burkholderiales bacterium]|nr:hypothetical protein [Burkholderiales bacterium]